MDVREKTNNEYNRYYRNNGRRMDFRTNRRNDRNRNERRFFKNEKYETNNWVTVYNGKNNYDIENDRNYRYYKGNNRDINNRESNIRGEDRNKQRNKNNNNGRRGNRSYFGVVVGNTYG